MPQHTTRPTRHPAPLAPAACFAATLLIARIAHAQPSTAALRFYATGVSPPGQQDRVRIPIDDNAPGPDASTPCDVGAHSFTIEFWVRGTLADNPTSASGRGEYFDFRWIDGNIIVDRDIWGDSSRDWGVSIAGGRVRFGTGRADVAPLDQEHTIEGGINVLDGAWHHVAVTRDRSTGRKAIFIDSVLDYLSPPNRSRDDISYPNAGDPGPNTPWGPYIVLAAEKHDAGSAYPSFAGFMDELRVWNVALSPAQIAASWQRLVDPASPGLVGSYRFEEGSGTNVASSALVASPPGELLAGVPGNGEWALASTSPLNVAPVLPPACDPIDFNRDAIFPDNADLADFFAAFAGAPCPTCADLDFNNDGVFPDNADLASFVAVFAGGDC
jgi:hypothetical protein